MANEIGRGVIPIHEIVIGERVRTDPGDIDVLALSISVHGLLDPIIVHQIEEHKYELVDGYRRILAHKKIDKYEIAYRLFDALDPDEKIEFEIELCLRRKSLTFIEEARACKHLLSARRRTSVLGKVGRFSNLIKNKEVAMQIGMSESTFSNNLKIAEALEAHPELEAVKTKRELLTMISRGSYEVLCRDISTSLTESYLHSTELDLIESVPDKSVDFCVIHPDQMQPFWLEKINKKLKLGSSIIIFSEMEFIQQWKDVLEKEGFTVRPTPYIWNVKGEDSYLPFLWAGKCRELPLRPIPMHMTYPKGKSILSIKAKPYNLMNILIRNNTESGAFVLMPGCEDLESVRCCLDMSRNVRASTSDRILRDRLLTTSNLTEEMN